MDIQRLPRILLLLLLLVAPALAEEETTPTLVLSVSEWNGLAARDLELSVAPHGGTAELARTNQRGLATYRAPELTDGSPTVSLPGKEGRLVLSGEAQRSSLRRIYLRLFRADGDPEALRELGESAGDLYRTVRDLGGEDTAPPTELTALRVFAFLQDQREEVPLSNEDYSDDGAPGTGLLTIRAIGDRGEDRSGVSLELFVYDRAERMVQYVTAERTNELGIAVFSGLDPDALYRVETARTEGTPARTGILSVGADEDRTLPPLVLHPADRTVSGFLLFEEMPAAGFEVRSRSSLGQPVLSTTSDRSGFFVLGPLRPGDVDLEFREPGSANWRGAVLARTGDRELLLPVDWLTP